MCSMQKSCFLWGWRKIDCLDKEVCKPEEKGLGAYLIDGQTKLGPSILNII
jgi:hypothetical protein